MTAWLTALGVSHDIQCLFAVDGNTKFDYGDGLEELVSGRIKVPASINIWRGGNEMATTVIISWSAIEAMAMLACNSAFSGRLGNIYILSLGCRVSKGQTDWIARHLSTRKLMLVFPANLAGVATDIAIATAIRRFSVRLTWYDPVVIVNCRNREYRFSADELSLAAFERAADVRSRVRTIKPPYCNTFLEQLYEQRK